MEPEIENVLGASPEELCSILKKTKDWDTYLAMAGEGGFQIIATLRIDDSDFVFDISHVGDLTCYGKDASGKYKGAYATAAVLENCTDLSVNVTGK